MKSKNKIIIYVISLVLIFFALIFEIILGNKKIQSENIAYSKTSDLNFITYLKDNSHYNSGYLKTEYNLVANLIDYFSIDYSYSYTLSKKIDYVLNYNVDAVLEVYDSDNDEKPIEKTSYVIKEKEVIDDSGQIIKVDLFNQKILYSTYSKVVEEWKKEISPFATLKISINVNWKEKNNKNSDIGDKCVVEFEIPISQKTISIKTPNNINETGVIKNQKQLPLLYLVLIGFTIILFVSGVVALFVYIYNMNKNKSKYDKRITKVLREFDRAITEATGKFKKEKGQHYIEVKDFMELLDVHDNINEPIIYYKNTENLSVFVVKNGKDNYYSQIKRSDYDK